MSLTFYYAPMTSATQIHWALEELGVKYEKVKLDLGAGDQRKPEYLALNPNGKVPMLVDSGTPIFESLAILIHLGETYGVEKGLFPKAGLERAVAVRWLVWNVVTLMGAGVRILRNTSERFPDAEKNAAAAESAKKEASDCLAILDHELSGKEYLLGSSFSLADLSAASVCVFMTRLGVDFGPHKNVGAWLGRCMTRPSLATAMQG